jgi:general stress protein YciG
MARNSKSRRGFAAMDPATLREISARGGRKSKGGGRKKHGDDSM